VASRWMQGVKGRERSFRRRQGNLSLTGLQDRVRSERDVELGRPGYMTEEERFYRPKINEDVDKHLKRMRTEARADRAIPRYWWTRLARVLQVVEGDLSDDERRLIYNSRREGRSIADCISSIERYRRLTGWTPPPTIEELKRLERQKLEERDAKRKAKRLLEEARENSGRPRKGPGPRATGFIINYQPK
jgi:hypothetical protein